MKTQPPPKPSMKKFIAKRYLNISDTTPIEHDHDDKNVGKVGTKLYIWEHWDLTTQMEDVAMGVKQRKEKKPPLKGLKICWRQYAIWSKC